MKPEHFLWVEKYRPRTVADCVLPIDLKQTFQNAVDKGDFPPWLLTGIHGTGKTTIARAVCEELGVRYKIINASEQRNIDTLRNEMMEFASTGALSANQGRKQIILDEADNLNKTSTQPALRAFMETYSSNCGFILTANYPMKLLPELRSRCTEIQFKIPANEKQDIAVQMLKRTEEILDAEGVTYNRKVLVQLIKRHFPDFRALLLELQTFATTYDNNIDTFVLAAGLDTSVLIDMIKSKDFGNVRQWLADHSSEDFGLLYDQLYKELYPKLVPATIPEVVLALNDGQVDHNGVISPELNAAATLMKVMVKAAFK